MDNKIYFDTETIDRLEKQQLIDYDVCSNWGNWAYLAGVGNDPRGNRYFNIEKQAQDYDKDKDYRKLWLADF